MDYFQYRSGQLYCEDVSVDELAEKLGTPLYIYSKRTLVEHYARLSEAFAAISPGIRFSVKSCWNTHILRLLGDLGAGMDVVSGGELSRALHAGIAPEKIVAAGVAKTEDELVQILKAGVGWLNLESEQECEVAARLATELGLSIRAAVRVNPDVSDPKTPKQTTTGHRGAKFGVDIERVPALFDKWGNHPLLRLQGVHAHIGSPIFDPAPYVMAIDKLLALIERLREGGFSISTLNLGGGFAADYDSHHLPWEAYAAPISARLQPFLRAGGKVLMEPGRTISGNAGILLSTVQYEKEAGNRKVISIDAGMTDLIRPALYNSYHFVWPTRVEPRLVPPNHAPAEAGPGLVPYDVVGPICESSDIFASGRYLPPVRHGDRVAIFTAGAYGIVQSSQYNTRPRGAEVLVDGALAQVIRRRETFEDLIAPEQEPYFV